jgi:hypothetical protein
MLFSVLDPLIIRMIACGIGLMLLIGAWQKMNDLEMFQAAVEAYDLIPLASTRAFSLSYVFIELSIAVFLICNIASSPTVMSAIVLMSLTTFAISINLIRGNADVSCGCGGIEDEQRLSWGLVSRNIVIIVLLGMCLIDTSSRAYNFLDGINLLFGATSIYLVYLLSSQLIANRERLTRLREGS